MRITKDYHVHSKYSKDAKNTYTEMMHAAKSMGITDVCFLEHSFKHVHGIKKREFAQAKAEAHAAGAKFGMEVDIINQKGDLAASNEYLQQLDFVAISFHKCIDLLRVMVNNKNKNTAMYLNAIRKHKKIDMIAHPNRYISIDLMRIARVCARRNILLEINGRDNGYTAEQFEQMQATGVKFIVNSDAHIAKKIGHAPKAFELLKQAKFNKKQIVNLELD